MVRHYNRLKKQEEEVNTLEMFPNTNNLCNIRENDIDPND